jgi:hypothetical protein
MIFQPRPKKHPTTYASIPGQAASPTFALSNKDRNKKRVARPVNAGAESYMNQKL